ncbi:MAG: 2Fe-2S iron-sulfur cluster-binding protein, partial [Vicinamibacterales bacterium]|nr:2Fe-2S iron-sulfur cluster-binding protein [Vicinamibacterales bacterium]
MSQEIIELTEETTQPGVSRRSFIKGAIAASAAVSSSNYLFRSNGGALLAQSPAAGAVERLITLNINGRSRRLEVPPMETLGFTLRYKLGLTGTKIGCDRAECVACSVLVEGVPHYSCSVLTHSVRGREVTSIEGLEAEDGTLHPMQQAVLQEQGFQCAFCMSGFIMNTVALLNENSSPTRKEAA